MTITEADFQELLGLNMPWRVGGACRGYPSDWWFPPKGSRSCDKARSICGFCTVRPDCLQFALEHPAQTETGVWGGATYRERQHLRLGRISREDIEVRVRGTARLRA